MERRVTVRVDLALGGAQFAAQAQSARQQAAALEQSAKRTQAAQQQAALARSRPGGAGAAAPAELRDTTREAAKSAEAFNKLREGVSAFNQVVRTGFLAGAGLMAGGLAALPPVSEHVQNSFKLLAGEIGISVIPEVARVTGWAQSGARAFRSLNESTGGAAGKILFWGTAALGVVSTVGTLAQGAINFAHALRSVSAWASTSAAGLRGLGAQAAATGTQVRGAAAASSAASQRMGSLSSSGGLVTGTAGGAAAARSRSPFSTLSAGDKGLLAAAVVGAAEEGFSGLTEMFIPAVRDLASGNTARQGRGRNLIDVGAFIANPFTAMMQKRIGSGIAEAISGGGPAAEQQRMLTNRQAQQVGGPLDFYGRLLTSIQNTTAQEAEQTARAMEALTASINTLNGTIAGAAPGPSEP